MELELRRNRLDYYEAVLDTCANHEETTDVIVPDASPDIMRILGAYGTVSLKDESIRDGQYTVVGVVSGWVLYVSEGETTVRRLEVSLPFSHTFEKTEIETDDIGVVKLSLAMFDAREVNPRKVAVRANVALCANVYQSKQNEIVCGVEDAETYGVECAGEKISIFAPIAVAKKDFVLNDDLELAESAPKFASMLRYDAELKTGEKKIVGKKAVVKGVVCIKCVYLSADDEVVTMERELPYSQIVEAEEMDDACVLDVVTQQGDLKLEAQYDMTGDVNYLMLNLPIRLCVLVLSRRDVDTVFDLYSTRYPLDTRFGELVFPEQGEQTEKRISISETLPCEDGVERVLDVTVRSEPVRKRPEDGTVALANAVSIHVMYLDKNGIPGYTARRVEAICPLDDSASEYRASARIGGVSWNGAEDGVVVRCYVDYDIAEKKERNIRMPEQLYADCDAPIDMSGMPSVIVRRVLKGDTLWNLAKKHGTTVAEIVASNRLENTNLMEGETVLIPLKRR